MMSSGTSRAARTSKDKANKVHTTQNVKSEGPPQNMKNQPTAEQMRLAQMISDKNEEDPDLRKKIKQVTELTACSSEDSALLALHDCDYDLNRAVERLLENENNPSEWKKQAGKKRKPSSNKPTSNSSSTTTTTTTETFVVNSKPEKVEKKEKEVQERGESAPRGRRDRGPPRFQRGRGRETTTTTTATTDDNDSKFWSDNRSRERGFERGRGRGRGASGGRGRGRGSRGFKGSSSYRFEKGPQIDTWTNETAENAEKENSIGAWGDVQDEWVADEWTGSLEESKVFTSSAAADSKGVTAVNDNDAKMFTPPPPTIQTQVFTAASPTHSNPSPSTLADTTNTYQHSGSPLNQNSLSQHAGPPLPQTIGQESSSAIPQNSMGQHHSIGQPSHAQNSIGQSTLGPRLDLEMLLNASKAADASNQQYLTQFAKEAEESIKIAVGIGINNSANSHQMPMCIPATGPSERSALPCQQQPLGQRQKAPRTKLPPPSRIPESAVEMPGGTNVQLDVQFGNWEETMLATTTPTPPGFNFRSPATDTTSGYSFGSNVPETSGNNSYTSTSVSNAPDSGSLSNHLSAVSMESNVMTSISNIATTQSPISTLDTGLDTVAESSSQSSMFPNPSSSTPPKDYSQSGHTQSAKISSPPDQILYPTSQNERSSAAYNSQRSNQSSGSLSSNKSGSSQQMAFTQAGYSSGYQPSSYKPSTMATSGGYSHTSSGLQNQSQYTPGYQSSSFPPNSGYNQGQSSLYHQSPNQSNSFQSQTAATYQSQSYSRDSQSAGPSYQASVSQNSSSYQSGASPSGSSYQNAVSNSTTGTYQRDSQSAGQTGGYGQSYGSSNHQNSLQTSPMSANKLSESLSNMSVDDTGLDQTAQYKGSGSISPATTLTTPTPTNSNYLGSSSVSVTSALGLTTCASSSISSSPSASTSKSTLPVTSRAPPGVPPGVPLIGATPNIMIGQQGFHLPFGLTAAQQPAAIYGFDELQLLQQQQQQRQAIPADYYSLQFQTPTSLTGREQTTLGTIQYNNEGKLNHRVSANSPVNAVNAGTSQTQQTQSAHQQTFINPTIPPGYNYYYHGGVIPGGYSYTTPYLPVGNIVPSVTNAHGATTASVQFQKPGAYGTHAYTGTTDVTGQAQDLSKTYGGVAQPQGKASAASLTSSASDITAAGVGYGKSHAQTFDKSFPGGTPPPFNLPLGTGNQAGPMGAPAAAYGGQYVPMMTHQPHSQILAHHLQQDTSGGGSRASQQSAGQPRAGGAKNYTGYWGTN